MKMHKTILTMLAAILAIIGTTTTVAHAEGPVVDEGGGTTQALVPENVLSSGGLANWNALTSDNRTIIMEEIIPEIPQRVPDVTLRPGVLASLVSAMLDIQEQRERAGEAKEEGTGVSKDVTGKTLIEISECYYSFGLNATGASSMMSCDAQMANINVYVRLAIEYSTSIIGDSDQTCWNCSFEWATVPQGGAPACSSTVRWFASGYGDAEGYVPDGPHPRPSHGGDEDTYCQS